MRKTLVLACCSLFFLMSIILYGIEESQIERADKQEVKGRFGVYKIHVPCNRWNNLMVAFHISPPLDVKLLDQPYESGVAMIQYGDDPSGYSIDLTEIGGYYSSGGLRLQPVIYLPSRFFRICSKHTVVMTIEDLGIDLGKHQVLLYVMKDGRP